MNKIFLKSQVQKLQKLQKVFILIRLISYTSLEYKNKSLYFIKTDNFSLNTVYFIIQLYSVQLYILF